MPPVETTASAMRPREAMWVAAGSLAFAIIFMYPMLCELGYLGPGLLGWLDKPPVFAHLMRLPANGDWDMFTEMRWVSYYTVAHFHQLPFWSPCKCGGISLLGNPESAIVTPFFLLDLLTGPIAGLYLQILLHLAIGFGGSYFLARTMGLAPLAGLVSAAVFMSCSWIYLQLSMGNLNLSLPIAYWPWIIGLYWLSIDRARFLPAAIGGVL